MAIDPMTKCFVVALKISILAQMFWAMLKKFGHQLWRLKIGDLRLT
jgi:hypothetical protein